MHLQIEVLADFDVIKDYDCFNFPLVVVGFTVFISSTCHIKNIFYLHIFLNISLAIIFMEMSKIEQFTPSNNTEAISNISIIATLEKKKVSFHNIPVVYIDNFKT